MSLHTTPTTVPPSGFATAPRQDISAGNIWSLGFAIVLAAFYLATSIYIASRRPFWFDEVFVFRIAHVPSIAMMWTALGHAADTMPPGYHLIMRLWTRLFGYGEVSLRLPSALAMVVGLLLTYDCARRLTNGLHGLIALSVSTCSLLPYYGYEARPYGFYFLLSAVAFWIWTCTKDNNWSALWFGLVLCLAVTMHYYAVLCIVPYVLWEVINWRPRKLPSRKLVGGVVGTGLAMAILLPLAMAFSRQFARGFWAHPTFYGLRAAFVELFPDGLLLLVLMMIWIVFLWPDTKETAGSMTSAEALGWLFLCIPLVGFVLAEVKTNAFLMRYFIGALPGVAVAFSCMIWRHFRNNYRIAAGVLVLLAGWGILSQWATVRHPESIDPFGQQTALRQYLEMEGRLHADGKRYIVFGNPMLHIEAAHYSRYPDEIVLLVNEDNAQNVPTVRVQVNLSHYSTMQLWTLDDVRSHAAETALIDPPPEVLEALKQAGLQVTVRYSKPLQVMYLR